MKIASSVSRSAAVVSTSRGWMGSPYAAMSASSRSALDPKRLYEDPFDGVAPEGPDALFSENQIVDLIARIRRVDESADPADESATA